MDNVDWNNYTDPFGIYAARGMPPPPLWKPADIRREARAKSSQIHRDYNLLRSIAERHENKIQKRWEKKSKPQRLAILQCAWPHKMPLTHRPDFAAFRQHHDRLTQRGLRESLRGAFMWPYINQEDLVKPNTFPLLLNSRARNHPSVFAAADGNAMSLGCVTMVLVPPFLNEYVMLLNGMTREQDYGKLVAWEDHEDAFEWMTTRKQFLPGEGLFILEAQAGLLSFLLSCCRQILHDIPAEKMISPEYPVEPEPVMKTTNEGGTVAGTLPSLRVLAEETPYRPPQKLDLQRIISLLAARVASAQDHIWALREDPGYFLDELLQMKEHRQEMIKDVQGNIHPTLQAGRDDLFWARVIRSVVQQAIIQLEFFTELHNQALALQALKTKYEARSEIKPELALPNDYLTAILKFRYYLKKVAKADMDQLKMTFSASPPARHMFSRQVPESPTSNRMMIQQKSNTLKNDKFATQLYWLLRTLWEDGDNLRLCGMPLVVDELERLLRAEAEARALVSPYIAMIIGELSIVTECLQQTGNYQPWANGFEYAMVDKEAGLKSDFEKRTRTERRMMESLRDENLIKAGVQRLGEPGRFKDYPVSKRRNKAVVEALRAAEQNLDAFWVTIDNLLLSKVGADLDGTAVRQFLSSRAESQSLHRTPEWVEPPKQKEKSARTATTTVESITGPLSSIFLGSDEVSIRKEILASVSKTKVKSRGTPNSGAQGAQELKATQAPPGPVTDSQPSFAVDSRALKVFRILFFDPSANTTPGEVAWNDFLHAMIAVGFGAQKLYGSVWHFQPTSLDVERSIQFHEPHPHGKLPFLVARRYGRRLNRAYGWLGRMFTLKT
ncbi:hypothetical protein V8F20_005661 [Naviculisporaceae sp. PSN 640]